jgi:hypothetical protein
MADCPETPMMRGSPFPSPKESVMRQYSFILRACVVLSLLLASAFMAGWKWEHLPH